jgi:hypothetical protein
MKTYRSYLNRKALIWATLIVACGLTYQNCGQPRYDMKDPVTDLTKSQGTPAPIDPADTVCDPNSNTTTLKGGLVAELYYLNQKTTTSVSSVNEFFDPAKAEKSSQQIFFNQINMPPQLFNQGFVTQNGKLVTDNAGNKLYEWFALKYFSEIKVTRLQDEGLYEFATLSDDGVVFEAQINGQWKSIISDDGLHAPKWGCSSTVIELKKDKPVPIRVYYFQGPAQHIANMLHWRKLTTGTKPLGDKECGMSDSNYFFDPATSTPLAPYKALLTRGWQVVPASFFQLPSTVVNPCHN